MEITLQPMLGAWTIRGSGSSVWRLRRSLLFSPQAKNLLGEDIPLLCSGKDTNQRSAYMEWQCVWSGFIEALRITSSLSSLPDFQLMGMFSLVGCETEMSNSLIEPACTAKTLISTHSSRDFGSGLILKYVVTDVPTIGQLTLLDFETRAFLAVMNLTQSINLIGRQYAFMGRLADFNKNKLSSLSKIYEKLR